MKKVLWQKHFFESSTWWSWTLQNYLDIYTVPAPTSVDMYSDKINSTVSIRIYPHNYNASTKYVETTFNIRIVKSWKQWLPLTTDSAWNEIINIETWINMTTDDSSRITYEYAIISDPKRKYEEYPIVLRWITLESWDAIRAQSVTWWITIQIFGEELQYDTDAHFRMQRDRMITMQTMLDLKLTNIYDKMEERRAQELSESNESQTKLDSIISAINNIEWCCT